MHGKVRERKAGDVYSFCMLLIAILTGLRPYPTCGDQQVVWRVSKKERPEIPSITPDRFKLLIERGFSEDTHIRMSMSEAVDYM
jgi:hypothetical protein